MTPEEAAALATELEGLVSWSAEVLEATDGAASEADLLEDLEERLVRLASRLRGRSHPPHTFYHPMPEEG